MNRTCAKMTDEIVRQLRDDLINNKTTYGRAAKNLGVSKATVILAAQGRTWKHVDGPCVVSRSFANDTSNIKKFPKTWEAVKTLLLKGTRSSTIINAIMNRGSPLPHSALKRMVTKAKRELNILT